MTISSWIENLPESIQQTFKMVAEKENWTAKPNEELSSAFNNLIGRPDFIDIIESSDLSKNPDEAIALITYLRIEQAICFLRMIPIDMEESIIGLITLGNEDTNVDNDDSIAVGRQNLFSRLETLSRLNMLDRLFSVEYRTLILNALSVN